MIGSYKRDEFYPTLDSIKKLRKILNTNILCNEGYSKFLLNSSTFKDKLFKWRIENNHVSERGYSLWEDGTIMNITTYFRVESLLVKYNLI